MKSFNAVRKYGRQLVAGTAVLVASATPAFAAIDEGVTTALGDAKADVLTVGGLVLVVLVAAAAFKYVRRAL